VPRTLATWRADLVARRLRLRPVVLIGASVYIAANVFQGFWPEPGASAFSAPGASVWSVANVGGPWVLLSLSAWSLFQAAGTQQVSVLLPTTGDVLGDVSSTAPEEESKPPAIDPELLRRLQQWNEAALAYRRALALAHNEAARSFLSRRLAEMEGRASHPWVQEPPNRP